MLCKLDFDVPLHTYCLFKYHFPSSTSSTSVQCEPLFLTILSPRSCSMLFSFQCISSIIIYGDALSFESSQTCTPQVHSITDSAHHILSTSILIHSHLLLWHPVADFPKKITSLAEG